jgi:hypothetical protein
MDWIESHVSVRYFGNILFGRFFRFIPVYLCFHNIYLLLGTHTGYRYMTKFYNDCVFTN